MAVSTETPGSPLDRAFRAGAIVLGVLAALSVEIDEARAAGYEVGENTTLSLARGGTGVVSKRDPSALYFNPALLHRADGLQLLTDVNAIDFNLAYQRDDLVYRKNRKTHRRSFDGVENSASIFPIPAAAVSYDFGVDNLGVALGVFGPHSYGERCFGEWNNGNCSPVDDGAARHMLVHSDLIEVYASAGAGYRFELRDGELSIGGTAILAHQNANFTLIVNSSFSPKSPWEEKPENESTFSAENLTDWRYLGIFGVAYSSGGFQIGASYRPPVRWESTGTASVDFPESLDDIGAGLTDDELIFRAGQAGSLRLGWRWKEGQHPGFPRRPRYDIEFNGVWEDWSNVETFEMDPKGGLNATELPDAAQSSLPDLQPISQTKNWDDTFSLRVGGSWGALSWLTLHGGGFLESGAQPTAYTSVDFPSWGRYAGSLGASFHPFDWLDLKLAFMHVASSERDVSSGHVYQQIPTSACRGPEYDSDSCESPGEPPGNPQNEGTWSANYNIGSIGATFHFY